MIKFSKFKKQFVGNINDFLHIEKQTVGIQIIKNAEDTLNKLFDFLNYNNLELSDLRMISIDQLNELKKDYRNIGNSDIPSDPISITKRFISYMENERIIDKNESIFINWD